MRGNDTIKAVAVKPGWTYSGVTEASYQLPAQDPPPVPDNVDNGFSDGSPAPAGSGGSAAPVDSGSDGGQGPAEPASPAFSDVAGSAYYYDAVQWAVENGITTGTTARTFSPDDACTRAQMVTFLWRASGSPEPAAVSNPFGDVAESAYYYKAVLWAYENGITTGTGEGTFSPDDTVSRAQTVTFLWRASGSPEPAQTANPFGDVAESAYYYKAVQWAVENGVTQGTSAAAFSPDDACTRAQIVTFLYRARGEK